MKSIKKISRTARKGVKKLLITGDRLHKVKKSKSKGKYSGPAKKLNLTGKYGYR